MFSRMQIWNPVVWMIRTFQSVNSTISLLTVIVKHNCCLNLMELGKLLKHQPSVP